jgi:hypothetical protein
MQRLGGLVLVVAAVVLAVVGVAVARRGAPAWTAPPPPPPAPELHAPGTPWDAVPVDAGESLGALRAPLLGWLDQAVRPRVQACLAEGGPPPATARGAADRATELLLSIETRQDRVVIDDVSPSTAGLADPPLVDCVARRVRRLALTAPGIEPGRRYRVLYPVQR